MKNETRRPARHRIKIALLFPHAKRSLIRDQVISDFFGANFSAQLAVLKSSVVDETYLATR